MTTDSKQHVGANILSILTESLYDNPIVVFREYVQNSVDSILASENHERRQIIIEYDKDRLIFVDNGKGICEDKFLDKMKNIGISEKRKNVDLGYKGIGRLSGVPYCDKVHFINVPEYGKETIQEFVVDGDAYFHSENNEKYQTMDFSELMNTIGSNTRYASLSDVSVLKGHEKKLDIIKDEKSGFIVVLDGIAPVLKQTIEDEGFLSKLKWLLPLGFEEEVFQLKEKELFSELSSPNEEGVIPVVSCKTTYNGIQLYRPIIKKELRKYTCKVYFEKYAVGIHTFNSTQIKIDKTKEFSGMRLYIDNMLLCDETEIIQNLKNYGLLNHTVNEYIQAIRGIGAAVYITDKISISANARRTFIEVIDAESIGFLKLLVGFLDNVVKARYDLSKLNSASSKDADEEKINNLQQEAYCSLVALTNNKLSIKVEELNPPDFSELKETEKKRLLKQRLNTDLGADVKRFINEKSGLTLENVYSAFKEWLCNS